MDILQLLKMACALGTALVGVPGLFVPRFLLDFTGLEAPGPRGRTEIRAVFGGLFIGLGLAPLVLGTPEVYRALGIGYLVLGITRILSILVDRSFQWSNWASVAFEIGLGVVLVL